MAVTTPFAGLEKPDELDYYDVGVFNRNSDRIDAKLKAAADDLGQKSNDGHTHAQGEVTDLPAALAGKATTATYSATIPITGWVPGTNQYTRSINVPGILPTDNPIIDIIRSSVADDREAQLEAWSCVELITTAADTITLYATAVPETALTLQIKVVR